MLTELIKELKENFNLGVELEGNPDDFNQKFHLKGKSRKRHFYAGEISIDPESRDIIFTHLDYEQSPQPIKTKMQETLSYVISRGVKVTKLSYEEVDKAIKDFL